MILLKIITFIVTIWFVLKIKRFISGIQIRSGKPTNKREEKSWKADMDIKDADYEDIK
mgnify:CR=1 FL=1